MEMIINSNYIYISHHIHNISNIIYILMWKYFRATIFTFPFGKLVFDKYFIGRYLSNKLSFYMTLFNVH